MRFFRGTRALSASALASLAFLGGPGSRATSGANSPPSEWIWTGNSWRANTSAVQVGQANESQPDEIIVLGAQTYYLPFVDSGYWATYEIEEDRLEQLWASRSSNDTPMGLLYTAASGSPEVVVWSLDAIAIYDAVSKERVRSIPSPSPSIGDVAVADVDAVPGLELVVIDYSDLFIFDFQTGALRSTKYGFGALDVDVGQTDDDAALEIGLTGNALGSYLVDGETLAVEWATLDPYGWQVAFVDTDSDGTDELIRNYPGLLEARDPESGEVIWSRDDLQILDLEIGQFEGEGARIVAHAWDPDRLLVIDVSDGNVLWSIPLGEIDFFDLGIGQVDADPATEIVVATDGGVSFRVVDTALRDFELKAPPAHGPFTFPVVDDLDLDGDREFWFSAPISGGAWSTRVEVELDALRHEEESTRVRIDSPPAHQLVGAATGSFDSDPQPEICVVAAHYNSGSLTVIDGVSREIEVEFPLGESGAPVGLFEGDLGQDGSKELVVARWDGSVTALGGAPLEELWTSEPISGGPRYASIRIGQLDADQPLELIVSWTMHVNGGYVAVVDAQSGVLELGPYWIGSSALEIVPGTALSQGFVVVGTYEGVVAPLNLQDGTLGSPILALPSLVSSLRAGDLDDDGVQEILVASNGVVSAYELDGTGPIWSSGFLEPLAGDADRMKLLNSEDGRAWSLLVGTGVGFALLDAVPWIFVDGFESGSSSSWSSTFP